MCFQSELRAKKSRDLSREKLENFYRKHSQSIMAVNLTGGEPFLRPFFTDLLELLDSFGIITTINTNGTLISSRIADRIAALKRLRSINISIDGPAPVHDRIRRKKGSHQAAMNSVKLLRSRIPAGKVQINTMIMPENIELMDSHILSLDNIEIKKVELIFPGSYVKQELARSEHILSSCGLPFGVTVTPDKEILKNSFVSSARVVKELIKKYEHMQIKVVPDSFLKDPDLFLSEETSGYSVSCSKIRRKEIRIDGSGNFVFCDTLRFPLGDSSEYDSLDSLYSNLTLQRVKKAISHSLPSCKRCCKSTSLKRHESNET